jgi:hypothetical protein
MLALALRTQLPPQAGNAALRVPKPMKLYSANTDQCGANIHSTPAPTVQPVRLLENSPICVSALLKKVTSVLVHAAPPCAPWRYGRSHQRKAVLSVLHRMSRYRIVTFARVRLTHPAVDRRALARASRLIDLSQTGAAGLQLRERAVNRIGLELPRFASYP